MKKVLIFIVCLFPILLHSQDTVYVLRVIERDSSYIIQYIKKEDYSTGLFINIIGDFLSEELRQEAIETKKRTIKKI